MLQYDLQGNVYDIKIHNSYEKTADEMFEELGYKCITFNFNGIRETIKFYKPNNNYSSNVIFDLTNKMFRVYCSEDDGAGYVDMKLLKAINQKCKEMGWLDD